MSGDPIFKDGFYVYANGIMVPESEAIMHDPCEAAYIEFPEPQNSEEN